MDEELVTSPMSTSTSTPVVPDKKVLIRYMETMLKAAIGSNNRTTEASTADLIGKTKNIVSEIIESVCDQKDWKTAISDIIKLSIEHQSKEYVNRLCKLKIEDLSDRIEELRVNNSELVERLDAVHRRRDTERLRFMIDSNMHMSDELTVANEAIRQREEELKTIVRNFKFDDFSDDEEVSDGECGNHVCNICYSHKKKATLSCGHELCAKCARKIWDDKSECPFCKETLICVIKRHV